MFIEIAAGWTHDSVACGCGGLFVINNCFIYNIDLWKIFCGGLCL